MPTPHTQHPSSGSAEIPPFDAEYIPTCEIPSELDISALTDHQIKGEALEDLQQIIYDTIIPSSWMRVPLSCQQMSLDEHNLPNTQRKMGQAEELANELTENTLHLISAINIATSLTVLMDDTTAFAEHWKKFCLFNQHLFPKQKSKPNHHFSDHIPELFQYWGPEKASATWVYERLIGVFAKMPKNKKICTSINKINIFTLIKHMN
ncbi:hypothetical protein O181_020942 [Austropuccinia psidii MF-1]|uniref:Uncharacterized protein n=1 Tax=Austropuccinia psidii MF-1 TaxID=1389203 RepID=A0A9Q3GVS9_9BASI|nr:hypothetical protein [Austropuccinia psidii MF-1]